MSDTQSKKDNYPTAEQLAAFAKHAATICTPSPEDSGVTYTLHCHCQSNIIRLGPIPSLTQDHSPLSAISCTCSICSTHALLTLYVPSSKLTTIKDGTRTVYKFNKKVVEWKFCNVCGSMLMAEPGMEGDVFEGVDTVVGVNLRCIDGLDLERVKVKRQDTGREGYPTASEAIKGGEGPN